MGDFVVMTSTGLPPREPSAQCEACGATGTVGRAVRTDADGRMVEVHRFCATCWAEQSARYRARWEEETRVARDAWLSDPVHIPQPPAGGASFESATWHATVAFLHEINRALRPPAPPTAEQLAGIAADIRAHAHEMDGPMPIAVMAFLRLYGDAAE